MRFIKPILCITIVFFSSYMSAMRLIDIYGEDPYRFGEIRVDELLNERDREEVENRINVIHGDHKYPEKRILIAKAVRLRLADCSPDRFIGEAVIHRDYWLVKDLLDHGADVDAKYGVEPIVLLTTSKCIAQLLVQHDVDLSATGTLGTILHNCHGSNYPAELMSFYITECGLDVNVVWDVEVARIAQGTPLHHLVFFTDLRPDENFRIEKIKILIDAGADLHAKTKGGFTPYDIIERGMGGFSFSRRAQLLALLNPDNQPDSDYNSDTQNQE